MIAAGTAVVLAVAGLFLVRPSPVAALDSRVCDLVAGWAEGGRPSGRVAIVEIDEPSVAQYGRWPWPRERLGLLVRRTLEDGAAAVVLDMMFPEADRGQSDQGISNDAVLAGALAGHPTVLGYEFRFSGPRPAPACEIAPLPVTIIGPGQGVLFGASGVLCSVAELSRAAAATGFLNAAPDGDGRLRRVPLVIEYNGRYYPSLSLAALHIFRPAAAMRLTTDTRGAVDLRMDGKSVPLEGPGWLRLRFRGPPRTLPYVSAADVMGRRAAADALRGRIAVIGGTAGGLASPSATPVDSLFPAVEIQATAIDNLLAGDAWSRPGGARLWEVGLLAAAGLASTLLLALVRSLWGALVCVALIAAALAGSTLVLSTTGVLLSPLPIAVAIGCNYSVLTLLNYRLEKRRADRTERQLASARRYTETVRAESEQRYQRLVENVNDAIIMDDVQGRLVFANRRFREWFGCEDRDIRGVTLEDYVAPEWHAALRDIHGRRMRGETAPDHFEFEGLRPDGSRIWIEGLVTTVREDGQITGTQSALRDITERKRIEAQYLQAQKMESIGRLAGGVAHDFNNLLTVINGYCAMLLSSLAEKDASRPYLEQILTAGEQAADLTQKLLTFSRKQLAHPKPLNLNLVVAEAEKILRRVLGEDIELITKLSPATGRVVCDVNQVHQVIMNLVVNSRDSMPNGGTLTIETKNVDMGESSTADHPGVAPGSWVYLGVSDTGVGMSEEVKRHLFEPFFTTKDPGKGTGLGLATVYGIVRQSGGAIRVDSQPDQGAAFHIYLPRIDAGVPAMDAAGIAETVPRGSETVLLVEDRDAVRQLTGAVLERYGYRVLGAASGSEALELAAGYADTIHLLLTDVVLPQMNGRALADELRKARPEMKVLYVSGHSDEVLGQRGLLEAGVDYVKKPFNPDVLAAKVRETLTDAWPAGSTGHEVTRPSGPAS